MKKFLLPLILPVALLTGIIYSLTEAHSQKEKSQSVNAVLGDASYVSKYGHAPDETTNENVRISTHLEYVENLLRAKPMEGLTVEQKKKRIRMLDLLEDYRKSGMFPRNYDFPNERKPCFIDKDGRICAVGFLVEKTAGREVAETINKDFKYSGIFEMKSPLVDHWIAGSGLTKEECAMIQPGYPGSGFGPSNPPNTVTKEYAITSSVFSGINLSSSVINSVQIAKGSDKRQAALVGIFSGAGQSLLGMLEYSAGDYDSKSNDKQRTLSMINIGLGTTTMLLSTWNLLSNRKPRDKKTTLGVNSFEFNNKPGMAFTLTRKL